MSATPSAIIPSVPTSGGALRCDSESADKAVRTTSWRGVRRPVAARVHEASTALDPSRHESLYSVTCCRYRQFSSNSATILNTESFGLQR